MMGNKTYQARNDSGKKAFFIDKLLAASFCRHTLIYQEAERLEFRFSRLLLHNEHAGRSGYDGKIGKVLGCVPSVQPL